VSDTIQNFVWIRLITEYYVSVTTNYPISSVGFTVINTAHEPVVGWTNNYYGPMGICAGAGTGILKTMYCNGDMRADMVPVDMAINSAIAVAWDLAQHM
jgi:hypothetical protein